MREHPGAVAALPRHEPPGLQSLEDALGLRLAVETGEGLDLVQEQPVDHHVQDTALQVAEAAPIEQRHTCSFHLLAFSATRISRASCSVQRSCAGSSAVTSWSTFSKRAFVYGTENVSIQ